MQLHSRVGHESDPLSLDAVPQPAHLGALLRLPFQSVSARSRCTTLRLHSTMVSSPPFSTCTVGRFAWRLWSTLRPRSCPTVRSTLSLGAPLPCSARPLPHLIMRVGSHMPYKARAQGPEPGLLAWPGLFLGKGPLEARPKPVLPGQPAGPEHHSSEITLPQRARWMTHHAGSGNWRRSSTVHSIVQSCPSSANSTPRPSVPQAIHHLTFAMPSCVSLVGSSLVPASPTVSVC